MIKTPVRYDGSDKYGEYIVDKDGTPILDVDPAGWMGSTQTITIGEYVATAINEHADIKAKLAVAVEALDTAMNRLEGVSLAIQHHGTNINVEWWIEYYAKCAKDAQDALAKIKEGV